VFILKPFYWNVLHKIILCPHLLCLMARTDLTKYNSGNKENLLFYLRRNLKKHFWLFLCFTF
jgi:hypothetical protein